MSQQKFFKVKEVWAHYCPDLDVFMSVALLNLFGGEYFSMPEGPLVKFVPAGPLPGNPKEAELMRQGILVLDTGFGQFDHHQNSNYSKCTLDLVAEAIRIDKCLWLQPILQFVRQQDLEGKNIAAKNGEEVILLTSVLRGFHLQYQGSNQQEKLEQCFWFLVKVMEAVIMAAKNLEDFTADMTTLRLLRTNNSDSITGVKQSQWISVLEDAYQKYYINYRKSDDYKLFQFITNQGYFSGEASQAIFTLYGIAYGLHQIIDEEAVPSFLTAVFIALDAIDDDWQAARKDWVDLLKCRLIRFETKDNKRVTMCGIFSPAYAAAKAARYANGENRQKAQLVICFRPNGQVQITCPNSDWWRKRLYLAGITLRMAELVNRGEKFTLAEIDIAGVCPKVPEWYVDMIVANGTWTNPEVPRTRLNKAQIIRLVQYIFYFGQTPAINILKMILKAGAQEEEWPTSSKPIDWQDIRETIQ